MEDPYTVLGVPRDADEDTIRKAYRKLAKKHHPDLNAGKPDALERFKLVNAANDILSDPEKRGRFDRGEIDAAGNERAPQHPFGAGGRRGGSAGSQRGGAGASGISPDDLDELFGQAFSSFGRRGAGGGAGARMRGGNVTYTLTVEFLDAANGVKRRLTLPDGKTLDVTIPPGISDGHVMRLKGQGSPGVGGGAAGDALVEVSVTPHPFFRRDGDDVLLDLPVTLQEAVLGTTIEVPTVRGKVRLTIPPGSGTGTKLRLRGRGIREGNAVVELKVVLPPGDEPALAAFLRDWKPTKPFFPRAAMNDAAGEA
jgi:DnaJ-class molecular chaperone